MSEYQRRTAKERSAEAQARAVARGVLPWPNVPPGYVRGDDGVLVPDRATRKMVAKAFRMRAGGATIAAVRAYLADHGIERSYHGVTAMLGSRVYLGQIHFGQLVNLDAHPPIVDRKVWQAVQRVRVPRGRRAKSDRLLARLGVLRCGSCGARLVVGTANNGGWSLYRCPPNGDCKRRVTISAEVVEGIVVDAVRAALADVEGKASAETSVREAEVALERAQRELDHAISTLAGFEDEAATRERLTQLRQARDEAREHLDQLGGSRVVVTISAATNWERLTLDERRALIRAVVERVFVNPGRGAKRVTVELVGH